MSPDGPPRHSGAQRNEGETLGRAIKEIICAGYDDADKSAVALTAERKITAVTVIIATRVEGSNEIIIMVICIINVRRPVSKVQDRLDE